MDEQQQRIDELYELVDGIETAMLATRRDNGSEVSRPMATQKRNGYPCPAARRFPLTAPQSGSGRPSGALDAISPNTANGAKRKRRRCSERDVTRTSPAGGLGHSPPPPTARPAGRLPVRHSLIKNAAIGAVTSNQRLVRPVL